MNQLLMFLSTFIIQFIIATEMNLISPLAPFLSQYFNIRDSSVVLFNLGYSIVGIFVPYLGILADKYGKKRILKLSLIIFVVGTIGTSIANNPILFALGRVLIGLGYFSLSGTNLSYISEFITYENRGKASGILRVAFGLAIFVSPIYGTSLINKFSNISSVYLPLAALGLIAYVLLLKLPETKKSPHIKINIQELISILKDPVSLKVLISLFLILTAPFMMFNFLGIYLSSNFNLSQIEIGIVYSIIAIGTISGIIIATVYSDKVGKLRLSKILFGIMVLAQIFIPYLSNLYIVIALAVFFACGLDGGWTAYQTFSSEIQPEKRGTFMSLFYTVNAFSITLFSVIGSIIYNFGGYKLAVGLGTIFSAIAMIILFNINTVDNK